MLCLLSAFAVLPAIAFLVVVHGTVLAALFAIRLVCRKSYRADRCRQNRKQNFRIIFHRL
jgi:hypothetical protein